MSQMLQNIQLLESILIDSKPKNKLIQLNLLAICAYVICTRNITTGKKYQLNAI